MTIIIIEGLVKGKKISDKKFKIIEKNYNFLLFLTNQNKKFTINLLLITNILLKYI